LDGPALEAVQALKDLVCEQVILSSLDEDAAIRAFHPDEEERLRFGPVRPGECLADSSGYAIGAGLVQMGSDLQSYLLIGSYSAGLTLTQMQQHPAEQELWSQLMAARAWKGQIGRYALLHWTDHAQLVRMCMMALERIDPKHFRWYQEIAASGSEMCSLAGRSMRLGDAFSRNPRHRDALFAALEARNGDLRQMRIVIKGFDLEEHRSDEPWNGELEAPASKRITAAWPGIAGPVEVRDLPEVPVKAVKTCDGVVSSLAEGLELPLVLYLPGAGPPERAEAERQEVWKALEVSFGRKFRIGRGDSARRGRRVAGPFVDRRQGA
jgi:hypothetical protein